MTPSDAYDLVRVTQSRRYWVVRDRSKWLHRYKVVTSDGRQTLFHGGYRQCHVVADALCDAFMDGAKLTAITAERTLS